MQRVLVESTPPAYQRVRLGSGANLGLANISSVGSMRKIEEMVESHDVLLDPEEQTELDTNLITGLPNGENLGVHYRYRCSSFLAFIRLSLLNDQNFETVRQCHRRVF